MPKKGDSGLLAGETFTLENLSDLTLITSANDGAYALAEAAGNILTPKGGVPAFVAAMNIRAEEIGMLDTEFSNPTGLDIDESTSGADGSAADVVRLVRYILENAPSLIEGSTEATEVFYNQTGEYHTARNTSAIVSAIPGLLGSKTGYTDLAGGNLVVAYDADLNHPVIIVVLGSTKNGRFDDVEALVRATNNYLTQ